jgi:hypothetical protein
LLVDEGERAARYFQLKDFEIVRKIKFAPKPNKPHRLDTLSNVLGDVRVGYARGDVRDHIVSHKNDHQPSYPRYRALQR